MITLTLLHPLQSIPVQNWTFGSQSVVKIGRASDNDVVLYSAVVSRYHVEIRQDAQHWQIVNVGANGTYIDDRRIDEMRVKDGLIIRMGSTGPKIQINIDNTRVEPSVEEKPVKRISQRVINEPKDTLKSQF